MGRYVNIMAKVSPECAARMERVAEAGGFRSKYEVLQAAVALLLKYADPGGEPANPAGQEQAEALRELFGSIANVRYSLASVKPNGGRRIEPSEIVAFYGKEVLMLRVQDARGNLSTTTNQRDILELVLIKILPEETLSRLRNLRSERGYANLLSVLVDVIRFATTAGIGDEVSQLFEDLSDGDPRRVALGIENKPARAKVKQKFD